MVFFQHPRPDPDRPLAVARAERVGRLARAFDAVVVAQVEISLLNTALTAAYRRPLRPGRRVQRGGCRSPSRA